MLDSISNSTFSFNKGMDHAMCFVIKGFNIDLHWLHASFIDAIKQCWSSTKTIVYRNEELIISHIKNQETCVW